MSRKTATTIIILAAVIAIVGLVAWYLFLSPRAGEGDGGVRGVISSFFPRGEEDISIIPPRTEEGNEKPDATQGVENQPAPVIREITQSPTAGFTIIEDKKSGPIARYMEVETGHIYDAPLSIVKNTRLTNTTIPRVREAIFLPSGNGLIARYLDDNGITIKSFAGKLNAKTATSTSGILSGEFLRDDIVELVAGSATDKILYLVVESGGASLITTSGDGSKPARVFSSPIREWLLQWISDNTSYLTTKASARIPGHLFSLNISSGAQTKIIGNIPGLTTNVSPKNTDVIYSDSTGSGFRLFSYNLKTGTVTELPLRTLAEKCTWDESASDIIYCGIPSNPEGAEYPDAWYKGLVNFNDDLWRINLKTGESAVVAKFSDVTSQKIDVIDPRVDKGGNYVVFRNKNTLSLWGVRVK